MVERVISDLMSCLGQTAEGVVVLFECCVLADDEERDLYVSLRQHFDDARADDV